MTDLQKIVLPIDIINSFKPRAQMEELTAYEVFLDLVDSRAVKAIIMKANNTPQEEGRQSPKEYAIDDLADAMINLGVGSEHMASSLARMIIDKETYLQQSPNKTLHYLTTKRDFKEFDALFEKVEGMIAHKSQFDGNDREYLEGIMGRTAYGISSADSFAKLKQRKASDPEALKEISALEAGVNRLVMPVLGSAKEKQAER